MKEQERLAFEDGRAYERARIVTELVDALDRYRESIGPDQHYTSQRSAMQDAIAYATVFIVKPMGKSIASERTATSHEAVPVSPDRA